MSKSKNALVIPESIPYDRNGKDDIIKYIRMFDKLNRLKSVGYKLKGKKYD